MNLEKIFPRLWEEYSFEKLLNFMERENPFFRLKGFSLSIPLSFPKTTIDLAGLWTLGKLVGSGCLRVGDLRVWVRFQEWLCEHSVGNSRVWD